MPAGRCPVEFLDSGDLLRLDDGTFAEVSEVRPLRRESDPGAARVELTYQRDTGEFVTEDLDPVHLMMVWATRTERLAAEAAA